MTEIVWNFVSLLFGIITATLLCSILAVIIVGVVTSLVATTKEMLNK